MITFKLGKIAVISFGLLMAAGCSNNTTVPIEPAPVTSETSQTKPDRGDRPDRGERPRRDLSEAAEKLGVTEDALRQALRNAGGPPRDFEKVADELGVSVEDLKAALPRRPRPPQ